MSVEAIQSEIAASSVLARWNALGPAAAAAAVLACCGSPAWAERLAAERPVADQATLLACSDAIWRNLSREDWQQAFESHPRLGESHAKAGTAAALQWSSEEQSKATPTQALSHANARYEQKFGHIFILCAHGRTTAQILSAIEARLHNDPETEWQQAGEEQRLITRLRLERWLEGEA